MGRSKDQKLVDGAFDDYVRVEPEAGNSDFITYAILWQLQPQLYTKPIGRRISLLVTAPV